MVPSNTLLWITHLLIHWYWRLLKGIIVRSCFHWSVSVVLHSVAILTCFLLYAFMHQQKTNVQRQQLRLRSDSEKSTCLITTLFDHNRKGCLAGSNLMTILTIKDPSDHQGVTPALLLDQKDPTWAWIGRLARVLFSICH